MSAQSIADNLATIRHAIREKAVAADRDPESIQLIAVSKTVDCDLIMQAYHAGQRDFGENRVQELIRKARTLPDDCRWHLIGHLQRNKVRQALSAAQWIHSIDSIALLERIERLAEDEGAHPEVLLQINVSGEKSKYGVASGDARALHDAALSCSHLSCRGLMTMAPYGAPESELIRIFGALRRLRDDLRHATGQSLPHLSMGMSGDYPHAIAQGATMVRIGTAIFGSRRA